MKIKPLAYNSSSLTAVHNLKYNTVMDKIKKHFHKYLTWFWILNFPVCIVLYFLTSEKVMGLYIALCSIYANVESSAGAEEAKKAQD